jgi:hypothetical protein
MTANTSGELCNGVAYINWAEMTRPAVVHSDVMRCIGRYQRFELSNHSSKDFLGATQDQAVSSQFVRSLGSTAIIYSDPDARGRRVGRAQALDPWSGSGVEVGPGEESLIRLYDRIQNQGYQKVLLDPMHELFERTILVAKRSASMFKSSIMPVTGFLNKMTDRVPELVDRSYDIATSIRIEIKIEEEE